MGIRDQICLQALANQQCFQSFAMAIGGFWNPDRRTIQPLLDLLPRFVDGFGVLENPRIGYQANESEKAGPRQPDGCSTAQAPIKPLPGAGVLRKGIDMGLYKCTARDAISKTPTITNLAGSAGQRYGRFAPIAATICRLAITSAANAVKKLARQPKTKKHNWRLKANASMFPYLKQAREALESLDE